MWLSFVGLVTHVRWLVKPQPSLKPTPLIPIPAFDEPFSRVLVDCVGPLPKTRSGSQVPLDDHGYVQSFSRGNSHSGISRRKLW